MARAKAVNMSGGTNWVRFTSTVVVGDKFKDIFNALVTLPDYGNCIKLVSTRSNRLLYLCLGKPHNGSVEVVQDSVKDQDAIFVSIEGDEMLVKDMIVAINNILSNHGFSLIDGEYEVSD